MTTATADHLTQRLMDWYATLSWTSDLSALIPVLLTELAHGDSRSWNSWPAMV